MPAKRPDFESAPVRRLAYSPPSLSQCFLRQSPQCVVRQQNRPPPVAELRAQRLVKLDRLLIPVEHLPMHSVTMFLHCNARDQSQQSLSNPPAAKLFAHKQIFQNQPPTRPRRVVAKEKSVPRRLAIPLGDERAKLRIRPDPILCEIRL